jgi:hypothetical protein
MAKKQNKPLSKMKLAHIALKHGGSILDYCCMCGSRIVTMIYKGTGVCGDNCRKLRDSDTEPFYPTKR